MGIFQRLLRILRAELNDRWSNDPLVQDEAEHDEELRRIIEELHRSQKQQTSPPPRTTGVVEWAYRTLGVSPTAPNEDIKTAYRRAIRQVHPDRFARASEHERQAAERRAQEINRAYTILKAVRNL